MGVESIDKVLLKVLQAKMLYNTDLPNALQLCAHTNQNTKSQGPFGRLGQSAAQSLNL